MTIGTKCRLSQSHLDVVFVLALFAAHRRRSSDFHGLLRRQLLPGGRRGHQGQQGHEAGRPHPPNGSDDDGSSIKAYLFRKSLLNSKSSRMTRVLLRPVNSRLNLAIIWNSVLKNQKVLNFFDTELDEGFWNADRWTLPWIPVCLQCFLLPSSSYIHLSLIFFVVLFFSSWLW